MAIDTKREPGELLVTLRELVEMGRALEGIISRRLGEELYQKEKSNARWLDLMGVSAKPVKYADPGDSIETVEDARFPAEYEVWYSQSRRVIRFLIPEREHDFIRQYGESDSKTRVPEDLISDHLIRSDLEGRWDSRMLSRFRIQLGILEGADRLANSVLLQVRGALQAELFDSELDAARSLCKKGFVRGAGAMAGVVLEAHLVSVCDRREIKVVKRATIANLNEKLRNAEVLDLAQWRRISLLADLRNKCTHKQRNEPKGDEVADLIDGVEKIIKTVF